MLESILETLKMIGWLGIILAILIIVNTLCGTVYNICSKQEDFSWKKMFKGLGKAALFYISAALGAVAFTMIPFVNEMITEQFNIVLFGNDLLNTLSAVGILGIVVSSIVIQAKKAVEGITKLSGVTSDVENITWEVDDDEKTNSEESI